MKQKTHNPDKKFPETEVELEECVLTLPEFYVDVQKLSDVVEADYFIQGCPPQTDRLVEVFSAIVPGSAFPVIFED